MWHRNRIGLLWVLFDLYSDDSRQRRFIHSFQLQLFPDSLLGLHSKFSIQLQQLSRTMVVSVPVLLLKHPCNDLESLAMILHTHIAKRTLRSMGMLRSWIAGPSQEPISCRTQYPEQACPLFPTTQLRQRRFLMQRALPRRLHRPRRTSSISPGSVVGTLPGSSISTQPISSTSSAPSTSSTALTPTSSSAAAPSNSAIQSAGSGLCRVAAVLLNIAWLLICLIGWYV